MCNLYAVRKSADEVARHFGVTPSPALSPPEETLPRGAGLVVRGAGSRRTLHQMSWGFPRQTAQMRAPSPVNLVADLTNPMWSAMVQDPRYRCLIPLTAFAEPAGLAGAKRRTWFSVKNQPIFAWAGFCRNTEVWGPVFGGMTSDSNPTVAPLNPRMPTLLYPHEYEQWLYGPIEDVIAFQFRKYPDEDLVVEETAERWAPRKPAHDEQAALFQ